VWCSVVLVRNGSLRVQRPAMQTRGTCVGLAIPVYITYIVYNVYIIYIYTLHTVFLAWNHQISGLFSSFFGEQRVRQIL